MKKLCLSFLFLMGIASAPFAQKTIADDNAEKRNVSGFHGIEVATGIELILTKGENEVVAVSAASVEYRSKIMTDVVNGVLKIRYETKTGAINKVNESKKLKAYVSYKALDYLNVSTGAKVKLEETLEAPSLELKATTGAIVKGDVKIGTLKVEQNTGSKITLSGKVESFGLKGDTGSKFEGEDLNTLTCDISVYTGAGVYITVEKEINVKANTGGYLKYRGNAGIREIKTNTGGNVSKI